MWRIPFSLYDFLGYMAPGFLVVLFVTKVFGVDDSLGNFPFVGRSIAVDAVLILFTSYVVGHILSFPSYGFVQKLVLEDAIGRPHTVILKQERRWAARYLFPNYCKRFPDNVRQEILAKAEKENHSIEDDELFFRAFALAKLQEGTLTRLTTFMSLYGFTRNMCFAGIVLGLTSLWAVLVGKGDEYLALFVVAVVVTWQMFIRFTKFYQLYHVEVLYAYLVPRIPEKGD